MPSKKTLAIYDFDDTLFKSGARVIVFSKNLKPKMLTSKKYATYKAKPGDKFDFSEFDSYPPNPIEIKKVTNHFREDVEFLGLENVFILTARGSSEPVLETLKNFSLPRVKIVALGSSDHNKKSDHVRKVLTGSDYEKVVLYEDNSGNINSIKRAVEEILGEESFLGFRVFTYRGKDQIVET